MLPPKLTSRRVLAFAPDVLPLQLEDEAEFRAAVMGLVQVSHHLPIPVCSSMRRNRAPA